MSNVVRVKFSNFVTERLKNELASVIMKHDYDEVKCGELYGILFMLMQEFYARQED